MIWPAILTRKHVEGATLHANRIDMIESIKLPPEPVIAEIGVAMGEFSKVLIDHFQPAAFHAFDIFTMHDWPLVWNRPTAEVFGDKTHGEFYRDKFAGNKRVKVFEGDSSTVMAEQPDRQYDLIYLDGDHEYAGVMKDTEVALKKIKKNGILVFNDYMMYDQIAKVDYGVVQAVNGLCEGGGWKISHFALHGAMFCDVALSRRV